MTIHGWTELERKIIGGTYKARGKIQEPEEESTSNSKGMKPKPLLVNKKGVTNPGCIIYAAKRDQDWKKDTKEKNKVNLKELDKNSMEDIT